MTITEEDSLILFHGTHEDPVILGKVKDREEIMEAMARYLEQNDFGEHDVHH